MQYIIKSILVFFLLSSVVEAQYCAFDYNCTVSTSDKTGKPSSDLNCTLPKIQTLRIKAQDVIDNEGNLKEYWDKKTVCDVLGWMNGAVDHIDPNYNGLSTNFTQTMDLELKNLQRNIGGITGKSGIKFDSDRPYLLSDDGSSNFHWLRMHFIVVHEFSHFIEKNSQAKTHSGIPQWVEEGRAKDFEDIVYDTQNPYSDVSTSYKMYEQKIANVLNGEGLTKYEYPNFVFFKALRNKCGKIKMSLLMNKEPDLKKATDKCTDIPKVGKDDLAGLFTLYNWAMLYKQDLSLLDINEPKRPNDKIFDGEYKKIDEKDFSESINIRDKIGTLLPPFSAKSFLITHETLEGEGDMNLTFESNGDLKLVAIRVKGDGSSTVVNNKFVMSSGDTAYKLTKEDRAGGLFVTLVNTTDKKVKIEKLKISTISQNYTKLFIKYFSGRWDDVSIPSSLNWDVTTLYIFNPSKYTLETIAGHASGDRECQINVYDNSAIYGDPRFLGSPLFQARFEEEEYMKNIIISSINGYPHVDDSLYTFNLAINCILEKNEKSLNDISSVEHQGYTSLSRRDNHNGTYDLEKYSLFRIYYK